MPALDHVRIAIVGLGYVGLPLAVEFGKQFDTVGFDIGAARVATAELFARETSTIGTALRNFDNPERLTVGTKRS